MAPAQSRIEDHHAEWLSLVETSGPFLTVPTLKRALAGRTRTRPGCDAATCGSHTPSGEANPDLTQRWVRWVLDELLGLREPPEPMRPRPTRAHRVAEQGVTLRPSYVLRDHTRAGAPAVLLVHRVEPGTALDRPIPGESWAASPIDRAAELARASGVALALVTDGRRWTLVWAREGETTGTCTWRTELWLEEPITLRAFVTLLGAQRFFSLPVEEGLAALLQESAGKQQEVADQLGAQVRRAVELLIATLDREDRDRHGELLHGARERRGLPRRGHGDDAARVPVRRRGAAAAADRRSALRRDARCEHAARAAAGTRRPLRRGPARALDRRLAPGARAVSRRARRHRARRAAPARLRRWAVRPRPLPVPRGSPAGIGWRDERGRIRCPSTTARCCTCSTRCRRSQQGGARVLAVLPSLDVEQIGHVYEGLLDHTALRITDPALALAGKLEPELALGELEGWAAAGDDTLVATARKGDRPVGRRDHARPSAPSSHDEQRSRLRAACGNDDALLARVEPYHALLRDDLRGDPLVFLAGSLFVTQALDRRASGTYYTPRVTRRGGRPATRSTRSHTTQGRPQERDPAEWKLKTAERAARAQDRRHRDGLRRVPRRRLPLPRRAMLRPGR